MSKDIGVVIGQRIRNHRKRRGISQEELAHLSNFSVSFIGEVERAEKSPSLENLHKICRALEITIQELFEQVEPANKSKEAETISNVVNQIQPLPLKDLLTINQMIELMFKFRSK